MEQLELLQEPQLRQVKNSLNYNYSKDSRGELNYLPSMTVPDQSYSVQEIMERWASGLPLGGQDAQFEFDNDTDIDNVDWDNFPDLQKMDKAERAHTLETYGDYLQQLNAQINQQTIDVDHTDIKPAANSEDPH